MIGAHSQVSIRLQQRSVLSKRHLVRTFYPLISSVRDLSLPHSNRTPGSKFKCCRRRDARCSHRQLGMIGTIEYLFVVCVAVSAFFHTSWHHQIPVICTSHLPTFASKRSCCVIIKHRLPHIQSRQASAHYPGEYPVLVMDTYRVKTVLGQKVAQKSKYPTSITDF